MSIDEMPDVQDDETLREVVAALSTLPAVSEADVLRIVGRAAADDARSGRRGAHRWSASRPNREPRDGGVVPVGAPKPRWFSSIPLAAAATLVFAAGIGGFVLRDLTHDGAPAGARAIQTAATPAGPAELTPVAADARGEAPIATQFVLEAPTASRVSLVGAFNGWDAGETPLVRDPATGLWSVTLPLAPGRHVYAFMVDDSVLTLDPRAPETRDPELGTSGSVVLVGTP